MQAKNLKKQAVAKARSAALTPAQRSKIAAKAALKKAGYPRQEGRPGSIPRTSKFATVRS